MTVVPALNVSDAPDPDLPADTLPSNLEAEQALLGCLMYDNDALFWCDDLEPKHFREPFHGRLFAAIRSSVSTDKLAEPIVLADAFQSDPAFHELGGVTYLADLYERAPPTRNTKDYAASLIELSLRRQLIEFAGEVDTDARMVEEGRPAAMLLDDAERRLFDIAETQSDKSGFVTFEAAVDAALEMAAQAYQRDGALAGLSTGLKDLDQKLGGLHPSDLLILAGRPSMGKTAIATNIAFNVARTYRPGPVVNGVRTAERGGVVGFFSLEMSEEQLASRVLSEVSGVASDKVRRGEISATEFGLMREAKEQIRSIPLHIDSTGAISIAKLTARARRLKRKHGLDLIVVDYLQLITVDGASRNANRVQDVTAITGGLKALAKDLNVPVIALSQLSRQVENREDKKPQLSDLRESGSIEQDADAVMFVYREAYYLGRAEPKPGTPEHLNWSDQMSQVQGLAELIIGKQRHGPIGTVRLAFNENTTKFSDLARDDRFDASNLRISHGGDR